MSSFRATVTAALTEHCHEMILDAVSRGYSDSSIQKQIIEICDQLLENTAADLSKKLQSRWPLEHHACDVSGIIKEIFIDVLHLFLVAARQTAKPESGPEEGNQ